MERLQFGECRCCLSPGRHQDLMKEYLVNGQRRIYLNIITECFNIYLSTDNRITTLICSSCIKKILAAARIRYDIVESEEHLLKAAENVHETEFVDIITNLDIEVNVKEEETSDYDAYNAAAVLSSQGFTGDGSLLKLEGTDGGDCDSDSASDISREKLHSKPVKVNLSREQAFLSRFPPATIKPLPSRDSLINICPVYFGHLEALKDEKVDTKAIKNLLQPKPATKRTKVHHIKENDSGFLAYKGIISAKEAQTLNATTLLENSTATAFKPKTRSGFPCYYCRKIFIQPKQLREHQLSHPKSDLYSLFKTYSADTLVVYADITELKCTICNEDIPDLNELKKHLSSLHDKVFFDEFSDRVIPFKLEDKGSNFECQVCRKVLETFGATDRHMNIHYKNYVCELCGAGFITKHRMKIHTYILHGKSNSVIKCEKCKRVFASKFKLKIHDQNVHQKLKKIRCIQCSELFVDYFTRQRHLEEKHGVEPLSYKCEVCDKSFNRKYSLTLHFKRIHLAKKDVQCDLCPFMCYNKSELTAHMYKHRPAISQECSHCHKVFSRKKGLAVHMKSHHK